MEVSRRFTQLVVTVTGGPMRVELKKRAPDGTTTDLGRAVDTSIGFVNSTWPFDVTVPRTTE